MDSGGGNINSTLVWAGVILMIVGAVISVITFGAVIICSWPIILVGLVLFIIGLVNPGEKLGLSYGEIKIM